MAKRYYEKDGNLADLKGRTVAIIVDGNALAQEIRESVSQSFAKMVRDGLALPRVAIVQIGDDLHLREIGGEDKRKPPASK